MGDKYTHRERIMMTLRGDKPDRPAVSLWRHFYNRETTAENLAGAMLEFQKKYDWDFMKINPRASYHVEAWGNQLNWSTNEFQKHQKRKFAVEKLSDWDKIGVLPYSVPILAEHLMAIKLIRKNSGPDLPILMTIFNPISIAGDLVPNDRMLLEHLAENESLVMTAIENITITFEKFVAECRNAGADGIFLATTQWGSADLISYPQYEKYACPYDLRIIRAGGDDALNLFHLCESNIFIKELADYPIAMFNWESNHPTNPSLEKGAVLLGEKAIVGGIDHSGWLMRANPQEIKTAMEQIAKNMEKHRFIFGPGCAIDPLTPTENISAVRNSLQ
jgi:uroporphyrinogen decarboxylase